jgi:hypothetical protein
VRCSIRSCRCRREDSVNSASQRRRKKRTHLLNTRTEQLPQRCHDARLLPCSRRTVEKRVRKITLGLRGINEEKVSISKIASRGDRQMKQKLRTRASRRADSSEW